MLTVEKYRAEMDALRSDLRDITALPQGPERQAKLQRLAENKTRLKALTHALAEADPA